MDERPPASSDGNGAQGEERRAGEIGAFHTLKDSHLRHPVIDEIRVDEDAVLRAGKGHRTYHQGGVRRSVREFDGKPEREQISVGDADICDVIDVDVAIPGNAIEMEIEVLTRSPVRTS